MTTTPDPRPKTRTITVAYRVATPHARDCNGQAGFVFLASNAPRLLDYLGRAHRSGARYWIPLTCNNGGCPALVYVRAGALEILAEEVTRRG